MFARSHKLFANSVAAQVAGRNKLRFCTILALVSFVVLASSCSREVVEVYKTSKETRMAANTQAHDPHDGHDHSPGDGHDHGDAQRPSVPGVKGKAPSNWKELPAGGMRAARFEIPAANGESGGDVSVIPLPAFGGGEAQVVNLWRDTIKLPTLSKSEISASGIPAAVAGEGKGTLYDMTSSEAILDGQKGRILAVIFPKEPFTWYFKLMGTAPLVEANKTGFLDYLKSIEFLEPPAVALAAATPASAAPNPAASVSAAIPAQTAAAPARPSGPDGGPQWELPGSWQSEPAPTMALAAFSVSGDGGAKASITVTKLGGAGGGVLPNYNRWRGQLGLAPADEAELRRTSETAEIGGERATIVDISGKDARSGKDSRMLGAMVLRKSESWFFKMTGDGALVGREKEAFVKWIKSMRFK